MATRRKPDPVTARVVPEDIGVRLTDRFMIEPEASVSAMVFQHPDARFFGA